MRNGYYLDLLAAAPSYWVRRKIRDVGTICAGGTPSRENHRFWGGGIPWVTPGELTDAPHRFLSQTRETISRSGLDSSGAVMVPADTLLVTTRATLGARAVAAVPMATNQGFKNLVVNKKLADVGFLYHLFGLLTSELERRASGTTFLEISGREFGDIEVAFPSVEEQRRIAEILDTLDLHVSTLERAAEKQETVAAALAATLIPVLPDPARLGEGWDLVPLSDVVPSADYGISTPLTTEALGTPTLRMNNLEGGRIKLHEVKYSTAPVPEKLILREGDVLFNRTNSIDHVGRTAIWRNDLPRATFASYLVRLNVKENLILPQYLVCWLNHPAIQQRIRRWATPGVHQVNINPTNLRRTYIEVPKDLARQREIIEALNACEQAITQRKSELDRLRLLKQGLLGDLLSGRVRVSEAEAVLERL